MYFNLVNNGLSQAYVTSSDPSTFWGWTLSSIDETPIIYQFNVDINSSDIEVVGDFKLYQNYQKYPAYKFGNLKYKKGKLTTLPYSCEIANFSYTNDVTLLNNLIDFLSNKKKKVLKSPNGDEFIVCTMSASYKYLDGIKDCPYHLSFSYLQIGNI